MRSRLTLLAAFAVFLAFAGLSPDDLHSPNAAFSAEPVAAPAATEAAEAAEVTVPTDSTTATVPLTPTQIAIERGLERFEDQVQEMSHPYALRYAFQAYYSYRARHPEAVRKPYFYFVDFGLDSRKRRGYVFDMEEMTIVHGPFTVAHGRGSASGAVGIPTRFLNRNGSNATSLGLYLAQETYSFRGKSGGRSYRSVGLRLKGLSGSFNSAARARGIVVHGAPYVTADRAGRSEGCPAMELELAQQLIPMIADGGLVFHFSPADSRWMREDPWASGAARLAFGG